MYKYKPTMAVFVRNCNEFFKSNPPTVIFFLCLVTITSVTIFFTIYIKNTDKIINSDDEQNWISLSKHLNKLNLCVANDSADNVLDENTNEEVSLVMAVNLNSVDKFSNATKVDAYYYLEDWEPVCGKNHKKSHFLRLSFAVTQNLTENENGTIVCAIITGPKEIFPHQSVNACYFNEEIDEENTISLYSQPKFCSDSANRTKLKFSFNANSSETYLTQSDKKVIYVHLLWSSYILLFFVLIMLIYAMFYQTEVSLKSYRLV